MTRINGGLVHERALARRPDALGLLAALVGEESTEGTHGIAACLDIVAKRVGGIAETIGRPVFDGLEEARRGRRPVGNDQDPSVCGWLHRMSLQAIGEPKLSDRREHHNPTRGSERNRYPFEARRGAARQPDRSAELDEHRHSPPRVPLAAPRRAKR